VLFDPDRQDAFNRYVLAMRDGQDPIPAFQDAFGMTLNEADAALRQYRREPLEAFYYTLPETAAPDAPIETAPLSAGANALLMTGVRMRSSDFGEEAQTTAQSVRERAEGLRDDPFVAMELARAEAMGGDPAVAQAILSDRLAAAPDDAEAHYLMGLSHLRPYLGRQPGVAEAAQRARRSFAAANAARPDHYPTLYRYALCEALMRGSLSPQALDVAVRAHDLAPQVSEIAVFAAAGLLQAGRAQEAADAARLVAYSPHVTAEVEVARAILQRAMAASGQAAP
jgi:hypothetical protein